MSDLPAKIAGMVPEGPTADGLFTADDWVEPKEQRKMDRFILLGMAAAAQAVADSGWVPQTDEAKEPHRRDDRFGDRWSPTDLRFKRKAA